MVLQYANLFKHYTHLKYQMQVHFQTSHQKPSCYGCDWLHHLQAFPALKTFHCWRPPCSPGLPRESREESPALGWMLMNVSIRTKINHSFGQVEVQWPWLKSRICWWFDEWECQKKKKSVQDREGGGGDKEAALSCCYGNWRLGPQLKGRYKVKEDIFQNIEYIVSNFDSNNPVEGMGGTWIQEKWAATSVWRQMGQNLKLDHTNGRKEDKDRGWYLWWNTWELASGTYFLRETESGQQCWVMGKGMLEIRAEGRSEMVLQGHQEIKDWGDALDCSLVWRTPEEWKPSGVGESIWQWVQTGERITLRTEPGPQSYCTEILDIRSASRLLLQGTTRIRVLNPSPELTVRKSGHQICKQDYWFREPSGSESRILHTELITSFVSNRIRVIVLPLGLENTFDALFLPSKQMSSACSFSCYLYFLKVKAMRGLQRLLRQHYPTPNTTVATLAGILIPINAF